MVAKKRARSLTWAQIRSAQSGQTAAEKRLAAAERDYKRCAARKTKAKAGTVKANRHMASVSQKLRAEQKENAKS